MLIRFTPRFGVHDVNNEVVLTSGAAVMLPGVLQVNDVNEREPCYTVRRVLLPASGIESFTVIGPDLRPVELIDEYLAWLTDYERSPNTVEAYAHDLRAFWTFLDERGLGWDQVGVMELGSSRRGRGVRRRTSWRWPRRRHVCRRAR
jgi:hypothetical protein